VQVAMSLRPADSNPHAHLARAHADCLHPERGQRGCPTTHTLRALAENHGFGVPLEDGAEGLPLPAARFASLERLQRQLAKLPGVGEKTALRYVLRLLESDGALARDLATELAALPDRIGTCVRCGHLAERTDEQTIHCAVCRDE
jgi:hypothetical protein